ncbi:hypothetical protein AKJ09_01891 [Labilithrix luteola]|uniref:Uncharacterized protein n=1 Tax=Labilithrix luteola TaxID=1391654 RepID=A0A0K1PNZ6_9BACT|nr:hypothetical protein [Labilithrix luteola]AKU95227.1 hypothetical protein AKJ09_01891 [Labilithrix luteola]
MPEAIAATSDLQPLSVRIVAPPPFGYDESELGRATHQVRLNVTNPNTVAVPLSPLTFRFVPKREGVEYTCTVAPGNIADRWPSTLNPGDTVTAERGITCLTPLPGRYDVDVHARAERGGEDTKEHFVGTFELTIKPSKTPPVPLPWDSRLLVAADATKEIRPKEKSGRLFVGVINASKGDIAATPFRADLHVSQRGKKNAVCADFSVDLPFTRSIPAGHMQSLDVPLQCNFPQEGIYDIDVTVSKGDSRAKIGRYSVRVIVVPVIPIPRPPVYDQQSIAPPVGGQT